MKIFYIPFPDTSSAENIAKILVEKKLAGCCQISAPVQSIYSWEGKIQQDQEVILWVKTVPKNVKFVHTYVEEHHPYDTPCIVEWDATANPSYLSWLSSMC